VFICGLTIQANPTNPPEDPSEPGTSENSPTPVAVLQRKIRAGEAHLDRDSAHGYLVAVLQALHVPVSSQVLVFSKTSIQRQLIGPETPRAIYFNDDIYVAWAPASDVIEVSDIDPTQGPRFYTLSQLDAPAFTRRDDCVRCHDGLKTFGVPGYLMGSNYTAPDGQPLFAVDGYRGGHRSPLSLRWGGWYVTGTHAGDVHLGNAFLTDKAHPEKLDPAAGANLTNLHDRLDTTRYLSPHSDIVALLLLEHQVRMHNLISRLHRDAQDAKTELEGRAPNATCAVGAAARAPRARIVPGAEAFLEYLLCRDEAPLQGFVRGTSGFTEEFQRAGPWDTKGRSLRQLDLEHRLLRFPCSYLIYSTAFDAFPPEVKEYLWERLAEILRGQDHSRAYDTMPPQDRLAVLEILQETKPEFAAWLHAH
jgi:hypothetical protein